MSWSVGAIGKAAKVAVKIEKDFSHGSCMEPEESVRQGARALIAEALAAQAPDTVVNVQGSGSQSQNYDATGNPLGTFTNYLKIEITPHGAFVE